ncbi:MAG: CPBP family intramembrane metalloprotease [Deltaproteobacteria bacterium]|nr:CPBP family intramembrane metalloprotease [Deltaproteobacteria bacterium]
MSGPALVRNFLGIEKFRSLFQALAEQSRQAPAAHISTLGVAVAILISALPLLAFYQGSRDSGIDYSTLLVGVSACLAMLYRSRNGIPFLSVRAWKSSLRLTHIAFALGCIPTLFMLLYSPQALFQISPPTKPDGHAMTFSLLTILSFIIGTATWAAVTEEFIYRGLLISVLRRWDAIANPRVRDAVAIFVSALLFGLAHLPTWGPAMSFALFGLGLGLGMAYVAIGELVLPVIVYHIVFDILSLSFAIFSRSF